MAKFQLKINNKRVEVECEPDTPLLWVIRENLGLTGTKYACGKALCGSCTVLVDNAAVRSCGTPVSSLVDKNIVTIEGIGEEKLHPVQQAWMDEDVPQCGFCQSGQIMSAVALLNENSNPSDEDIDMAMAGNICRCGTYVRIRKAIKRVVENL